MLAKFDKKTFPLKPQGDDSKRNEEEDRDLAYKLQLKAVMQQLETLVFDRN